MDYLIEVETVAEQWIAAARERTTVQRVAQDILRLSEAPWGLIRERPELRRDGHNVAVYWAEGGEVSVEVGVQVVSRFEPTERVVCSATPGGLVARAAHFGPYAELGAAHRAVNAWCKSQGRVLAGHSWEIYGDWHDDPAKLRTDVLWLLSS
jgi:effector-binding domain-containing protein